MASRLLAQSEARAGLEKRIGYFFQDAAWLVQALTHTSCQVLPNNERLEFLGDAALSLVLTQWLFRRYPNHSEGVLTRLRAGLVNARTLEQIAISIGLPQYLLLSPSQNLGYAHSILGDALEALFGAVFLDGGLQALTQVVQPLFAPRIEQGDMMKDPKTRLQEKCQAQRIPLPEYVYLGVSGLPPEEAFTMQCSVSGSLKAQGTGKSKKSAEQAAAAQLLELLGSGPLT